MKAKLPLFADWIRAVSAQPHPTAQLRLHISFALWSTAKFSNALIHPTRFLVVASGGSFMKNFFKIAILGAAFAASSSFALASTIAYGQISLEGTDTYTGNTVTFPSGDTTIGGMITGTFAPYFTDTTVVTMTNFSTDGTFVPTTVFSVTENGETLTYFLQTLTTIFSNGGVVGPYPGDLTLLGTGYFTETGVVNYASAPANFNLTTQYGASSGVGVTFSETNFAALAPEPSSIVLLGTGLFGAAFLLRRKLTT
jgi:hypothetical protein